jgi:hypothetical protein
LTRKDHLIFIHGNESEIIPVETSIMKSSVFWDITPCLPVKLPEDRTLHNCENFKSNETIVEKYHLLRCDAV